MGVYDSDDSNYSNPEGKRYYHKHDFNEEDNKSNDLRWCLGVTSPGDTYVLSSRKVPGVGSCATDEAYLFYSDDTRWNMNNEDHPDRTSLCVKVTPKVGATCGVPYPTADVTVNGAQGPITVAPNTPLTIAWNTTDAASCSASSAPVSTFNGAKGTSGSESHTFGSASTIYSITCTNASGSVTDSVTVNTSAASSVNFTVNGSDGPLTVGKNSTLALAWTSSNVTSCTLYGAGLPGGSVAVNGNASISASAITSSPETYVLTCDGITDSVVVNAVNQAPAAPTITGPTTANEGASNTFTITGTDPDSDQIYYQIDWDNDGTADVNSPASGFINSGTAVSADRTWSTGGTYTFQARTVDTSVALSPWTSHTVTIGNYSQPQYVSTLTSGGLKCVDTPITISVIGHDDDGYTMRYGIDWNNDGVYDEWLPSSGYVPSDTQLDFTHTWTASDLTFNNGLASVYIPIELETSNGVSAFGGTTITFSENCIDLKINGSDGPIVVTAGSPLNLTWVGNNVSNCMLSGGGNFLPNAAVPGNQSYPATFSSTYRMNCSGGYDEVIVDIDPTPQPPPPPNFIPPTFYNISYNNFNQATNEYGNITATMRVSNYGGSATGGSAPYEVRLDGAQKANGSIPPLVQNGYVDIAVTVPGPITVGSHTLTGEADKGNLIAESNENDNTGDYPITIPSLDPGLSITANPNRVQNNQNSNISWTVANPYSMNCSVFGPGMATVNFNPATNGASGNANVGPITAKSEYTISCTSAGTTFTAKTTIETQGVIEEI
jgi:hypothetical protein